MASTPRNPISARGGRILSGAMLSGALILIALAGAVIFWPHDSRDAVPAPPDQAEPPLLGIAAVDYPTPIPTLPPTPTLPPVDWARPTADPQDVVAALDVPAGGVLAGSTIARETNPLTIIPQRSRSAVITYTVQRNDNLRNIAGRFGLTENTIIWSNDRFYVNAMRIGLELNILPVDGVYHRVQQPQSIADIAAEYAVDPYDIIDSEYNTLFGAVPQTILPESLWVVVPGGTGSTEPIYWDPGIVMTTTTTDGSNPVGTGVNAGTDIASFAVGDPGSCGRQVVSGGSSPVGAPIWARYKITQDFSWNHGGIDLAVPPGTPVYAAGGGTVIFSGWSTWGYGYTVVIAHGGTLSVYGHLNGAFVGCGQIVTAGQNIAVTGSSGRSSGPHLHFEIRGSGGAPVSPWNYQSF